MSFVRDGIENVRGLILPDGVWADGRSAAVFGAAVVTWRSSHAGKFHQVYLNGRFAGVTIDSQQRRLVVQAPGSFPSAVHATVIAVEPMEAHVDFAGELEQAPAYSGRVRLTLLRSQALPLGTTANIYHDSGTGQIDYAKPVNAAPIPIWPCVQDKAGIGLAPLGTGDFGYDSAASVGFGKGALGHGQFGLDADTTEWVSPILAAGKYRFGVKITDASGDEGPAGETASITVIPAARPAARLNIAAFNQPTNEVTLSIAG